MVRIASPERGTAESPGEYGVSLQRLCCTLRPAVERPQKRIPIGNDKKKQEQSSACGAFLDAESGGIGGAAGGFALDGLLVAVAVAHLGDCAEAGRELGLEVVETNAPRPVAGGSRWSVHACFAAELENVLQRIDGDVCDGARGGANHRPDDLVRRKHGAEVGLDVGALVGSGVFAPPAERRVVVVRAGVDDGVGDVTMRKIDVAAALGEAELQDTHTGHAEVLAELVDFGGDEPEVFGDEGKVSEDFFEAVEESLAGGFDPVTVHGG